MDTLARIMSQLQSFTVQCVNNAPITSIQTAYIHKQDASLSIETPQQRNERQQQNLTNKQHTGAVQNCIKRGFIATSYSTNVAESPSRSP